MAREAQSEFAEFVRDAGVRAVDRLSETAKGLPAPVRAVLRSWTKLTSEQKFELFDALITITQQGAEEEAEPARTKKRAAKKKAVAKKPVAGSR
jgi:predicted RecB family endonuclease